MSAEPPSGRRSLDLELGEPTCRRGRIAATLVGGPFGDPLLHLQLVGSRRCLFFDLGDPGRLPARFAHRTSDVFVSHAHADHLSGFLWLLRCKVGDPTPVRLFGTAGLARRIASFVDAFTWDRVRPERAVRFEVWELHGQELRCWTVRAGDPAGAVPGATRPCRDGLLLDEEEFRVHGRLLDHAGLPVLALRWQGRPRPAVRAGALERLGLAQGPWIGDLKRRLLAGEAAAEVELPDGRLLPAERLLETRPGVGLGYLTDLGDTPANREGAVDLVRGVDVLFCEAGFTVDRTEWAAAAGHLTGAAGGVLRGAGRSALRGGLLRVEGRPRPAGVSVSETARTSWDLCLGHELADGTVEAAVRRVEGLDPSFVLTHAVLSGERGPEPVQDLRPLLDERRLREEGGAALFNGPLEDHTIQVDVLGPPDLSTWSLGCSFRRSPDPSGVVVGGFSRLAEYVGALHGHLSDAQLSGLNLELLRSWPSPHPDSPPPHGLPWLYYSSSRSEDLVPDSLGWLNYWSARACEAIGFPRPGRDDDLLARCERFDSGAVCPRLTDEPFDVDRTDHIEVLRDVYERFPRIGHCDMSLRE